MTNDNNKPAGPREPASDDIVHDVIVGLQYLSLVAKTCDVPGMAPILGRALKNCLKAAKEAYGAAGVNFIAELSGALSDNEKFIDALCRIEDPEKRKELFQLVQAAEEE